MNNIFSNRQLEHMAYNVSNRNIDNCIDNIVNTARNQLYSRRDVEEFLNRHKRHMIISGREIEIKLREMRI